MTIVSDLLFDALVEIGVKAPMDSMEADEAAHGLRVLNRMVQQWNAEELMIYTLSRNAYSFVVGQQSYTYGTGGNFNAARPVHIQMASVQDSSLSKPVEIPIKMLTDEEWRNVAVKGTTGTFPTCMWRLNNLPLDTLYFWPIPQNASYQVILYTWGNTADFAAVTTTVVFPKGYEEAIVTNMAIRLASSYGKQPDPLLMQRAAQAKDIITSLNLEPLATTVDKALLSNKGGSAAIRSFGLVVDR